MVGAMKKLVIIGAMLVSAPALAQQPPGQPPQQPPEARAFVNSIVALEHELMTMRATAEIMLKYQDEQVKALQKEAKDTQEWWNRYIGK